MPISKIIDDPQNPATMKTKFHTILLMIVMAMMTSVAWAQNNQKFSPKQFDADARLLLTWMSPTEKY